jgi:hypothetical protein
MTLDDIPNSIHSGSVGISNAFDLVDKYSKKPGLPEPKANKLKLLLIQTKDIYNTIPSGFLNRIAMTGKLKDYVKDWDSKHLKNASVDPENYAMQLRAHVEYKLNMDIIAAKQSDTKLNRQKEKKWVLEYFHANYNSFIQLYNLYNKFLKIKDVINGD